MKTTLWKRIVLLGIPVASFQQVQATTNNNNHLLQTAFAAGNFLHDSLMVKTTVTKNIVLPVVQLQPAVEHYVDAYLDEHDDLLDDIKQRNANSFKLIRNILVKHGLPAELVYMAVVESKMKNTATSGAGAAGIWQLMPSTARTFGLSVSENNDQRRNIYQSTNAAAKYLNALYKQFDDWLLVVAAYNCGSGNVQKAIKLSGSRDFWKLQRYLPKESRDHVKRFIATHFFYEEKGSIVTLTKNERSNYLEALQSATDAMAMEETEPAPERESIPVNWVLIKQDNGEWRLELRK
ncbi:MAG: lytic transglycosylase domain-containing protein [Chitinophagaceae bacterium]|nr:lytic transglycosylase domain-containing protein [Chitinophagaceae bacterium]